MELPATGAIADQTLGLGIEDTSLGCTCTLRVGFTSQRRFFCHTFNYGKYGQPGKGSLVDVYPFHYGRIWLECGVQRRFCNVEGPKR